MNAKHLRIKAWLEQKLGQSAFRRGLSAFRFGLIPQGYSDHLPVKVSLQLGEGAQLHAMSWNLLADEHLYNNFKNVTGSEILFAALQSPSVQTNIYGGEQGQHNLFHFFAELAQFLYAIKQDMRVQINPDILEAFKVAQPSLLTRSRDPALAEQRGELLKHSRAQIIKLLTDSQHPQAQEFQLALSHSLELIHQIKNGEMRWEKRFERLASNKRLVKKLRSKDVICLQECTDPEDMFALLNQNDKPFSMLTHQVREGSRDHCVILFDHTKLRLEGSPIKGAVDGKKPYILVNLRHQDTGTLFTVGSVHMPGGTVLPVKQLLHDSQSLKMHANQALALLGDFNMTEADQCQLETVMPAHHRLVFPRHMPTFAGNDHGLLNQAIDGVLTNLDAEHCAIKTVKTPLCLPTTGTAIGLHFSYVKQQACHLAQVLPCMLQSTQPQTLRAVAL